MSRHSERRAGVTRRRVPYLALPLSILGFACDRSDDPTVPADCKPEVQCPGDGGEAPAELRLGSWSGIYMEPFVPFADGDMIQLGDPDGAARLEVTLHLARFLNGAWRYELSFRDAQEVVLANRSIQGLTCPCRFQCPCIPIQLRINVEFPENLAPISGSLSGSATFVETGETYSAGPIAVTIVPP